MIGSVLNTIANAIANNKQINDFCETKYGQKILVFLGQDPEIGVAREMMPSVSLAKIEAKQASDQMREITFRLGLFTHNSTKSVDGQITTLQGFIFLEELAELLETCLLKINHKSTIEYIEYQSSEWPIFSASFKFIIEYPYAIRG